MKMYVKNTSQNWPCLQTWLSQNESEHVENCSSEPCQHYIIYMQWTLNYI